MVDKAHCRTFMVHKQVYQPILMIFGLQIALSAIFGQQTDLSIIFVNFWITPQTQAASPDNTHTAVDVVQSHAVSHH